jgi:hypothetical protein
MRKERWQQFRNCISVRANNSFHNLLSERQFRGRINIDHATKMLDIQVSSYLKIRDALEINLSVGSARYHKQERQGAADGDVVWR